MKKRIEMPGNQFQTIRTYEELEKFVTSFAEGKFNAMVLIGRPGISKSESVKSAIEKKQVFYCNGGQLTPLRFFMDCYEHRHELIILDDANEIMRHDIGKRLVMSLTDTRQPKTLDYRTTNTVLEANNVPTSFETTSRMCYISNSWLSDSPEAKALEDRAQLVWFDPTPKEVHLFTAGWFWDNEILDFVGTFLHLLEEHSCRTYFHASELKDANHDWKNFIQRKCYDTSVRVVQNLQDDAECITEKDRVDKFINITSLSRATYFNYKKELDAKGQLKPIGPEDLPPDLKARGVRPPRPEDLIPLEDKNEVEAGDEDAEVKAGDEGAEVEGLLSSSVAG